MDNLEKRIKKIEQEIRDLKLCRHEWIPKKNPSNGPAIFFNGCNAYIKCSKCKKRKRT